MSKAAAIRSRKVVMDEGTRCRVRWAVQLKHVTRSYGKAGDLLVIESIPMWSCPSCCESYFTAKTMHEVERIKALRNSISTSIEHQ